MQKSKTFTEQYECQSCGETISVYHIVWKCSRCGEEYDGSDVEETHSPSCGENQEPGSEYPGGFCEKHNVYYNDECPYCKEEENGGDNGGGNGNGGGTGGNGGLNDI